MNKTNTNVSSVQEDELKLSKIIMGDLWVLWEFG